MQIGGFKNIYRVWGNSNIMSYLGILCIVSLTALLCIGRKLIPMRIIRLLPAQRTSIVLKTGADKIENKTVGTTTIAIN